MYFILTNCCLTVNSCPGEVVHVFFWLFWWLKTLYNPGIQCGTSPNSHLSPHWRPTISSSISFSCCLQMNIVLTIKKFYTSKTTCTASCLRTWMCDICSIKTSHASLDNYLLKMILTQRARCTCFKGQHFRKYEKIQHVRSLVLRTKNHFSKNRLFHNKHFSTSYDDK